MNVYRSYVEVTEEGSGGFVLENKKQMGNVSNRHYFVLKNETNYNCLIYLLYSLSSNLFSMHMKNECDISCNFPHHN